ncbi:uncharacterized protein LOC123403430 isoform X2 [Hordeum vulgare subsp. vulgare]|uniref:uncharacterized protein LOC123403430 isoform X2 n=1 Tax=Hordeum vulgare subsp. vulgare TaxID=112509 RepID=UPI001D1A35CF|nr:uncharacterized protein LOC123403430 isoform X2 [Hordeum vulgare subsp. vulgare]
MEPSGSGAAEPGEDDRGQEPAHERSYAPSNGAPTAAVPPPPRATPLHLDQAGGGADGAAGADRKGNGTLPPMVIPSSAGSGSSSAPSLDHAAALKAGAFGGGGAGGRAGCAGDVGRTRGGGDEGGAQRGGASARPQAGVQAAGDKENRRRGQQFNSLRAGEAMHSKEQDKLSQAKVAVKVRPKHDKLFLIKGAKQDKLLLVKRKSLGNLPKSKIFHKKGREICSEDVKHQVSHKKGRAICSEHVKYQTHRISEVRRYYNLASDEASHLDAYSKCRLVIGDGECFYRSFIFSYLEQVIDRQDTHEEHRLLRRVSTQRANIHWNSEFSRSRKAFKELIKEVMKWKSMESTSSRRKEKLLKYFSTYDKTQDIFVFLRLLVAVHICSHREEYEPIIQGPGGNYSLEVWCLQQVIPARLYADHVMMVALARALEVPLRVESFQRGYAPDIYTCPGVPRPGVTLLYSGDHYDILYPRAPSAHSSIHQASQRKHPGHQSSSHQASQRTPC